MLPNWLHHIEITQLPASFFAGVSVDVLRLDKIHPIVSGNKWFKLYYHLQAAKEQGYTTLATFGGAYSNHIVATAFACEQAGLKSVGVIRGEAPPVWSHTLIAAQGYGMQLQFVSRTAYQDKAVLMQQMDIEAFWVPEGGQTVLGSKGAAAILTLLPTKDYTDIVCSCGTGTMMAGIVMAAAPHQHVTGVAALKGHDGLATAIRSLLPTEKRAQAFSLLDQYHFGGYAKHPPALLDFMNYLYAETGLPTDIVYTSKLLYAVQDLCAQQHFTTDQKLLVIHSGGLQGNLSLPANTLTFS